MLKNRAWPFLLGTEGKKIQIFFSIFFRNTFLKKFQPVSPDQSESHYPTLCIGTLVIDDILTGDSC